jgi:hypothetical protein
MAQGQKTCIFSLDFLEFSTTKKREFKFKNIFFLELSHYLYEVIQDMNFQVVSDYQPKVTNPKPLQIKHKGIVDGDQFKRF